ncbi:MAG: hypothetical protein H7Y88_11450 [Phycisphaerales bacterium]|nr:hypothetical protein [Phycisphaerales bacterium]
MSDTTWPALLAHWTEFARSSVALPKNAEGDRWRSAAAPIIGLQAVTFALGDLAKLEDGGNERPVAIDKASILIRKHATELHELWRGEPLHAELAKLIEDARGALRIAKESGLEWRVTEERLVVGHPGELIETLIAPGSAHFRGDLYLPVPGVSLFRGSPAAFCRGPAGGPPQPEQFVLRAVKEFLVDVSKPQAVSGARQVYRQFDFGSGRIVRDLVVPLDAALPAGQPQLVAAILGGAPQAVPLPIRGMADVEPVEVVFEGGRG